MAAWYSERQYKDGDLRVWCVVNPPNPAQYIDVASVEEAKTVINEEANVQLGVPIVDCNAFGLEEYDGAEWHEWRDDHDRDIEEVLDAEELA